MTREQFIFEVRVCQGPLRRFLTTLCNGDSARGDDLAQETMLRAWLASDRFRGSFRSWLFRIAYNVFVDHFRRQPQGIDTMDDVGSASMAFPPLKEENSIHRLGHSAMRR